MYMHILTAFGVMAHLLWVLLHHRQHLWSYGVSLAVVACFFLPWGLFYCLAFHARGQRTDAITGASWGALPYTFFTYAIGFSLGPSLAALHEERSLGFLLQFLPVIAGVGFIYTILLTIGLWSALQHWHKPALVLCLLGLGVPIIGAMVPSLITRPIFSVRYTISAHPYFCMLTGAALASGYRKRSIVGVVVILAVIGLSTWSLSNYFANPRYARENIKSAVSFWRQSTQDTQLLSNAWYAVDRYLHTNEVSQHMSFENGIDFVTAINHVFATKNVAFVNVLLIRDWYQVREKVIQKAFTVHYEYVSPGVKLLRIYRP
jgi:hypothetical protein